MKKISISLLGTILLIGISISAMEPDPRKVNSHQSETLKRVKNTIRKVNESVDLKKLLIRIVEIVTDFVDDKDITWEQVALLNDCIQNKKLEELDGKYINLEKFKVLRLRVGMGQTPTKAELFEAIKINRVIELFGYEPERVLRYVNPEQLARVVWDHYSKDGELKPEVMQAVLENGIEVERLPELLRQDQLNTIKKYFHPGKLLKLIAVDYSKGTISKEEFVKTLRLKELVQEFSPLREYGIKLENYVDLERCTLNLIEFGGMWLNNRLNRKEMLVTLKNSIKGKACAEAVGVNEDILRKYIFCDDFERLIDKVIEGNRVTKREFLGIFNVRALEHAGISIEILEYYINFKELVEVFNDLPTEKLITRQRVLGIFNIQQLEEDLCLPQGTVESILDPRVPVAYQQSRLERFMDRFDPETLYKVRDRLLRMGLPLIALWSLGHAICHPCMEAFEPQSFKAGMSLFALTGLGMFVTTRVIPQPLPCIRTLTLNTLVPRFTRWMFGNDDKTTAKDLIDATHPLYKEFDAFADSLEEKHIKALPQPYILGLAQHNPSLLKSLTNCRCKRSVRSLSNCQCGGLEEENHPCFICRLNHNQLEQLWTLIEKTELLEKLNVELPNFVCYYNFIHSLTLEQITEIAKIKEFKEAKTESILVAGQTDPESLLNDNNISEILTVDQRKLLAEIITKTAIFNALESGRIGFKDYTQFIESLTTAQIQLLSEDIFVNAQNNPRLLLEQHNFVSKLSAEQKEKLKKLIEDL